MKNKEINKIQDIYIIAPTVFLSGRGTSSRIYSITKVLSNLGYHIQIYAYPFGETPKDVLTIRSWNPFFWIRQIPTGFHWIRFVLDVFLLCVLIKNFIQKKQKKIYVYAHLYEGVLIVWLCKKIVFWKDIQIMGDFHGGFAKELHTHHDLLKNILFRIEKWIYTLPILCTASSLELVDYMQRFRTDQIIFLPDVPSLVLDVHNKNTVCKKYNIPLHIPIVVYAGGFSFDKNVSAIWDMMRENKDVFWVIAGGPAKMLFIPNDIPKDIYTVISPLSANTLSELLSIADVCIDPKQKDSLQGSGKIVNAMIYGVPIITRNTDTNMWYTQDLFPVEYTRESLKHLFVIKDEILTEKIKERTKEIIAIHRSVISGILDKYSLD